MPVYFTDQPNTELFARINRVCDGMELERGIRCSVHSRVLMFNAITAIREDPSPLWKDGPLEPAHVAAHMEADLPALIGRIMDEVAVDRQVTYYELLHWLGDNLDSLCPFVKTPRRSRRA